MSFPTVLGRAVEGLLMREARSDLGPTWSLSIYKFFLTGTSTPANVYQDGALTTPFAPTGVVTADAFGRFPAIYLDPSVIYRVQFFNSASVQQWQNDPYTSTLSTVGTSSLSAFGPKIATTGEITIPAPNTGGSGISLILKAGALGGAPLQINGTVPGNSALIINSSATTGAQTAVFQANNKPGTPPTTFSVVATAAPAGGAYVGGNLTANFPGPTASNYTLVLSTGQSIFGATFTNGAVAFTTPSTVISGTPTTALSVQTPVVPAGWLPIMCDGVQYYTPIWHGNNFSPYVSNPQAQGETIIGSSVTFGGTGITTAVGGSALPSNWFVPSSAGVGANYWINITKNGGQLSGLAFIPSPSNLVTVAPSGGAYTGGTLSTGNFSGNTASNYTLILSTGQVITGCTFTNGSTTFTCPSTVIAGTPNNFVTVTIDGVWANITTGGILILNNTGTPVNGTYQLSSSSTGTPVVASGTITILGNTGPQAPTYSGTTPLVLNGNGTATFNSVATSAWFTPTVGSIGGDFYILITPTGGTTGYSFGAGTGAYTNITAGGLSIPLNGSGATEVPNVTGTYIIASDSGGVNQLGAGTITITGTVTHTYNTVATNATETVPAGASFVTITAWGGGAIGGTGAGYRGGGGGGYSVSNLIPVTPGQTLKYTITAGGGFQLNNNASGTNGGNANVSSGTKTITTMIANGGQGGGNASGGAGGSASGGTTTNTFGSSTTTTTGGNGGDGSAGGTPGNAGADFNAGFGQANAGSFASSNGQVQFVYS